MKWTQLLQELRKMRFEQAWEGWSEEGRLRQFEAAQLLGVCERTYSSVILSSASPIPAPC